MGRSWRGAIPKSTRVKTRTLGVKIEGSCRYNLSLILKEGEDPNTFIRIAAGHVTGYLQKGISFFDLLAVKPPDFPLDFFLSVVSEVFHLGLLRGER